jgi:hypothetical protein
LLNGTETMSELPMSAVRKLEAAGHMATAHVHVVFCGEANLQQLR